MAHSMARTILARQKPTEQEWDELRTICREIMAQDTRPDEAAQAHMTLAESYSWQGRFAESGAIAEAFLLTHDPVEFAPQTAWAHFYAGIAAQEARRFEDSLTHLRWIKERSDDPEAVFDKQMLPITYHRIWMGLKRAKAPADAISQAEQEMKAVQDEVGPLRDD
jgi:hypothetical protein